MLRRAIIEDPSKVSCNYLGLDSNAFHCCREEQIDAVPCPNKCKAIPADEHITVRKSGRHRKKQDEPTTSLAFLHLPCKQTITMDSELGYNVAIRRMSRRRRTKGTFSGTAMLKNALGAD